LIVDKGIKDLYQSKSVHAKSHELLVHMCKRERTRAQVNAAYDAIFRSIEKGNFDFIFGLLKANSDLIWGLGEDNEPIFSFVALHRQAKIFSLIYRLANKNEMTTWVDKKGNTMLHMAGMTGASIQINRIPGAALQMQRELQWFKVISLI
jgi:hypothetical protein